MAFLIAALSNFYHHFAVFNFQGIDGNLRAGIVCGFAGLRIPLPAVPRADELVALDHALSQRAAAVQAHVVHRRNGSVHVGDADDSVAAGKFLGFAFGGKFGLGESQHLALSTQPTPDDGTYVREIATSRTLLNAEC